MTDSSGLSARTVWGSCDRCPDLPRQCWSVEPEFLYYKIGLFTLAVRHKIRVRIPQMETIPLRHATGQGKILYFAQARLGSKLGIMRGSVIETFFTSSAERASLSRALQVLNQGFFFYGDQ
jgi:hypothetical protein